MRKKTEEAGLDGVVCSACEVAVIKEETSDDFVCLTPGIRPAGAVVGDQKRRHDAKSSISYRIKLYRCWTTNY